MTSPRLTNRLAVYPDAHPLPGQGSGGMLRRPRLPEGRLEGLASGLAPR